MANTMSQKTAREGLGSPELFKGGVFVTKNGVAELFVETAEEREAELVTQAREQQANALLKLTMLAKQDVFQQRVMSPEEALKQLRAARK
ncbi:hypothetical protein [Sodalis sp. dw_23]|jgi:hypothetical protein|uniref:hypothetical protein n=1 Tax=unclassified Sodalis (in: enterobacteria) TaxID=2636512 RepID=UPI00193F2E21